MGQAIKFSSFGLHLSEPSHDTALEQHKMERGEQVHIYMSEIPGGLYNSCGFLPDVSSWESSSTIKQLCLHVHGYAQVLCTSTFQKTICEYLTAPKNIYMFLELRIFHSVCRLSFKSFFLLQKNVSCFEEKSVSIGVVCLIKSHRAGGQPAPFNYQVQVGRDQVVPTEAEGTACGVGGFCEVSSG